MQRTPDRMVLAGNQHTWLDFASAGTRANTPPAHNGAGNSLTTGSGTARDPLALRWIAGHVARLEEILADLSS